ncbi:GDP-mannose 4,6-dehydratase [Thomasclavelia sp.]|uniref:GDP-mannose 4,6-dehydratase n=1 Tax=Thomasclavelia sp. TaxID=3025757 RepID=UPI0025DBF5B4|nr:GDP-mannose 4,6-dehydratase [Thomasclavelia sp.]
MNKILIIGANGFVGNYIVKEYLKDNYEVIAADLQDSFKYNYDVYYEKMDILDKKNVEIVIKKWQPDYLINLAAISSVAVSWDIPEKTFNINVIGTVNILESIKKYNKKCKVLLVGSSEEYAPKDIPLTENDKLDANNPYGISKIAQENIAKIYSDRYKLNIICTRSFNHTGPGQLERFVIPDFCKQVALIEKSGKPGKIYIGNLSVYRDISDVRDIAVAYKILLEKHENLFDVFNVGSGNSYQMRKIVSKIISLSTQPIEIVVDSNKIRSVDTPYICCDTSKISKFNIKSIYSIDEILYHVYQYELNNGRR